MLRGNESKVSAMADPQRVGLHDFPHLVADDGSRSAPTIMLTSSASLHLVLGSLGLPGVDLSTGEIDLMST